MRPRERNTRGRQRPLAALLRALLPLAALALARGAAAIPLPPALQLDASLVFGRGRSAAVRGAYGSGIGCGAAVAAVFSPVWSMECAGAWLRKEARVDAPPFVDHTRGALTQWPVTLAVRCAPAALAWRPSVEVGGGVVVARETLSYELLGASRAAGATHTFPAFLAGAGVETRRGALVWRVGLRACFAREVRHVLRDTGRLDETRGSGAGGLILGMVSLGWKGDSR